MSNDKPEESVSVIKKADEKKSFDALQPRLEAFMRALTGNYQLVVSSHVNEEIKMSLAQKGQNPDDMWFVEFARDPVTNEPTNIPIYVHIPATIVERGEHIALAKAAHEAGHVVSSRFSAIPKEYYQLPGFGGLMASAEERPTDQIVRDRLPGIQIDVARRDDIVDFLEQLRSQHVRLNAKSDETVDTNIILESARHVKISRYQQFCSLVVRYPQYSERELRVFFSDEVVEAYEQVKEYIDLIEHMIPEEGAGEEIILKKQRVRVGAVRKKILPVVQKLMKLDVEDGKREMMERKDIRDHLKDDEDMSDKFPDIDKMFDDLRALADELQELELERLGLLLDNEVDSDNESDEDNDSDSDNESDSGNESDEDNESDEVGKDEEDSNNSDEMSTHDDGESDENEKVSDVPEDGEEGGAHETSVNEHTIDEIDEKIQQIKEKQKEIQEKLWKKLPDWLKKMIVETVEKEMKDAEDAIIDEQTGKMSSDKISTNHERQEEQEQLEHDEMERQQQQKEDQGNIQRDLEREMREHDRNLPLYEKVYQEIREFDDILYHELDEILFPNVSSQTTFRSTGTKANVKKLYLWDAAKGGGSQEFNVKPFEVTARPEVKDYVISLLVDLSGSMSEGGKYHSWANVRSFSDIELNYKGTKIDEAFKAVVLISEVLNRLGIRFNVLGFQDIVIPLKSFDESMSDDVRTHMTGMVYEVYNENPGGHNRSGGNHDSVCVATASKLLDKEYATEQILIVISDGKPTGPLGNLSTPSSLLQEAVLSIIKNTNQKVIGLGLGPETDHVAQFYPIACPNIRIQDLSHEIGELLKLVLLNPELLEEAIENMKLGS